MTTKEIADQLVALCRAGRNIEAVETLLSADVVSVEAIGSATMPPVMTGRDVIRSKNEWWLQNHQVHTAMVKGPFTNGERFTVIYDFVVTPKVGLMAGKRMRMEEIALYTVTDGKISREEFFYNISGAGSEPPARKRAKKKVAKARTKAKPARSKARKPKAPRAGAKVKSSKSKARARTKGKSRRR